ncbi:hypothetical protein QE152_g30666 [Popillia japonica]|uniref:Double jelly roll-like domain-containing protein n=1 Tax=Popillia japonica TaxID=7064 RepID=A0AAW1JE38_POPJA
MGLDFNHYKNSSLSSLSSSRRDGVSQLTRENREFLEALGFKVKNNGYARYIPRNFKTSDEIRISIQHQDVYTLPSESFIYIEGKFKHDAAGTGTCELTNNAYAFLFDQIRYEINGVEVDRCTKPGITSSIKGYISYGDNETKFLEMAGWCPNSKTQPTISLNNKFNAYIPFRNGWLVSEQRNAANNFTEQ